MLFAKVLYIRATCNFSYSYSQNLYLFLYEKANTDEETGMPSARHLQRVLSFFTQTTLGVLVSGPATESTVSTLLPVLTAGLKAEGLPDHVVSSYMILSQLFLQTSLAEKLLQSLLNVIAKVGS